MAYAPVSGTLVKVTDTRGYKDTYNTVPIDPVQFSTDSGKTWTVETYGSLDESLKGGTTARVSVFDMAGKKLFSRYYSNSASVSLRELVRSRGNYFVRVDNGKSVLFANRVIIVK